MTDRELNRQDLVAVLRRCDAEYPLLPGLVYRSAYGFIADHGRDYDIPAAAQLPWKGPQKMCFGNALVVGSMYGLRYCEGVAVTPKQEVIVHAWNLNDQDQVMDCTWLNTGLMYFGVEFSVERADDALWNGDGCILNDEKRYYPVFRQRWAGEDYSLAWPASDRIEALRRRDTVVPPSVVAFEHERRSR